MKVIVESNIPFIRGKLEAAGHVVNYLDNSDITPEAVRDADALIVRTRTRCDASLLAGSNIRKIATATIGTDHIDLDYCDAHGIEVHNAPGCNAPAVAQYVLSSIYALGITSGTIGIIGVGHVGSIVDCWARANGFRTLRCDPPLGLNDDITDADIITFHTPLDATTRHLADSTFFASLSRRPLIINAARGAVVDTEALIAALRSGQVSNAVIDCWEEEPEISEELLKLAKIATPHIAGYSLEGKRRASAMAIAAIDPRISVPIDPIALTPTIGEIVSTYDPMTDTLALKFEPSSFERLRNHYNYRPEPR